MGLSKSLSHMCVRNNHLEAISHLQYSKVNVTMNDFILVASLYVNAQCFIIPLSQHISKCPDKAETGVKDNYLYHELYAIKSTCQPETRQQLMGSISMKDGLINIKGEDRQERRQLDINDNREDHLDGDNCFGADMCGSKRQHGSLSEIIKPCLFLIMISPQREQVILRV